MERIEYQSAVRTSLNTLLDAREVGGDGLVFRWVAVSVFVLVSVSFTRGVCACLCVCRIIPTLLGVQLNRLCSVLATRLVKLILLF